ncbi:RNA polymerase sigma factor [Catenovulum agarivorans]|uniref:RNA polymerase sigma factor n=1 Tax=Catenovulum agarivorans TaxID=1172192 RepID=UPI00030A9BA4|nr:RNA polymerase sigma factor [Catenovulum agarivorans]
MQQQIIRIVPQLRRFAFALTGNHADADDLLQNTIEKLLRQAPEGDEQDLTKWAFRVCKNLWIDEYRSRKVRSQATSQPELTDNQTVDGEHAIQSEIALNQVNQAMDKLPDDQRSLIALIALEGKSYKEAAAALDLPIGTVMSRLARARSALAEYLKVTPQEANA